MYKKTEDDVYSFLTKKFRKGWTTTQVANHYMNLSGSQWQAAQAEIKEAFGVNTHLPTKMDYEASGYSKFTISNLVKELYKARSEKDTNEREAVFNKKYKEDGEIVKDTTSIRSDEEDDRLDDEDIKLSGMGRLRIKLEGEPCINDSRTWLSTNKVP